ncbi:hypothetical protein PWT90_11035 [Aphanocladium album]|nr:hypothetical protein PWT90_11035 [Aphanocladium album]
MMKVDDGEFQFDFSADEEQLLIQLATDAEARDSIAGVIDALPARSDFGPNPVKENGLVSATLSNSAAAEEAGAAAASLLLSDASQISCPTVKRALEDGVKKTGAEERAARPAPVREDFEDEFDDHRSPLQKFRSYPRRPLTVSDLTSGAWCELQYWYTLSRLPGGRRTRTAAMRQGSKLHQKLEDEVHTTVQVDILSRVDGFGLKLWNLVQGLRTLRETGLTRELEVWGILDGNLVNGVIDSLSHENPNPEFEFELSQEAEEKKPQQSKLTDFFASTKPAAKKPEGPKVYLADVKTRGSLNKVPNSMLRPAKIQLLLYHRFLSDLAAGKLDFYKVFRRYGLDPDEPFSDAFIAQMASLHDEMFDETPSSSWQTVEEGVEPTSSAVTETDGALQYKSLRELLALVEHEVNLAFPEGAGSMGSMLRVQYIYRDDGREIGHHDFPVSRSVLDDFQVRHQRSFSSDSGVNIINPEKRPLAMRRSRYSEDSDHEEQDEIPLHHKRAFGSGLKRKKVEFVRAQDPDDYISTLPSTKPTSSVVGDLYASIVLGKSSSAERTEETDQAKAGSAESTTGSDRKPAAEPLICPICSLEITTTLEAHEASLAHQVSLEHSHPPSALDRSRMGMRALASQGWDPDARVGLGREGEGTRYPIKVTPKEDVLGIGASVPEKTEAQKKAEAEAREAKRQLTAKERKARAVEERQRAAKLQAEIYGRQDFDKYLKGGGKEWE